MTSGNFKSVDIDTIIVDRPVRQRRVLTDLDDLAKSIETIGLINPPVVDENLRLIAGERRLTACRDILGWTMIPVQFAEDCSEAELQLIELEENVKRTDLTWQDQCRAVNNYHKLRLADDTAWTASKTAKALGMRDMDVSDRRAIAEALDKGQKLVVDADRYSTARNIVKRNQARAKDSEINSIGYTPSTDLDEDVEDFEADLDNLDFELDIEEVVTISSPFANIDFTEWAKDYSGVKFNFIHCDFPYGVNANKHALGASKEFGGYEDTPEVYWQLIQTLADSMDNLVAESAHMMFWFSMDFYTETKELLTNMGWTVNPFPLVWHKTDNSGIMPDPQRGPRRIYETAFFCSRGGRYVVQPVANTKGHANTKEIHMSEKPIAMLEHFFRMFVDENTLMLDPTMGSGNAVIAAENLGAGVYLGLERDEDFYSAAHDAYVKLRVDN